MRSLITNWVAAPLVATWLFGCSSSNGPSSPASCSVPGGAVSGPVDSHCGSTVLTVDPKICSSAGISATHDDAGAGALEYGVTLFNPEGDDDDCKYRVSWTSTSICENTNVTFNLKVTAKSDGSPVSSAEPELEVFLNDTHPGWVSSQAAQETSAGNYAFGPAKFDAKGQWTVRFHFFPMSCDEPTSPHGHAAFFVDVP